MYELFNIIYSNIPEIYFPVFLFFYIHTIEGKFTKELNEEEVDNFIDDMCVLIDYLECMFGGATTLNNFSYIIMGMSKYRTRLNDNKINSILTYIIQNDLVKDIEYILNDSEDFIELPVPKRDGSSN